MLADLDLALKRPTELVQRLYAEQPSLDGFDERVASTFSSLFSDDGALAQVPAITSLSTAASLPPAGSLVRFRAMVQDTGLGGELFQALGDNNEVFMYGAEHDGPGDAAQPDDYSKLRERQLFYVVSVPGESAWVKESLDLASLSDVQAAVDRLSISSSQTVSTSQASSSKYPDPSEPQFGLVAKLYGEAAEALKTAEVCEFVGVLGETTLSSAFDELNEPSSPAPTVPALHVVFTRPAPTPSLPKSSASSREGLRKELVAYLADQLGGDKDAAEWVLLALLARIHTRHATGMSLGSLSLNLAVPEGFSTDLASAISSLVPASTFLDLSIATLNDSKTRLAPRSRDESLDSGRLQLANGTAVVVDLRKIGEGKLEDTGVRNLRHLATTIAQQKLAYEFPYSSFEFDTDLNFVVLSEGKAIIPTDCVVYVKPDAAHKPSGVALDKAKLDAFRAFIAEMKNADFSIPEGMSEVIQSDFVERRQASHGGEGMSQDDLLFRMTAARLVALSYGETALSKEAWLRTAELDDRRKDRVPAIPQQPTPGQA
ncbi:uncharacterized protein JCM10292_007553 [Rhodotorula paludigena]|uniref:uncharacterized protein n=1 Tax=Rhodotorula paludigena TaxID=86838 RepID=UPI003180AA9D